jgi:hypothetical protein
MKGVVSAPLNFPGTAYWKALKVWIMMNDDNDDTFFKKIIVFNACISEFDKITVV